MMVSESHICNDYPTVSVLTCVQVPAGIFLPTIAIGASLGRAVGIITYDLCGLR